MSKSTLLKTDQVKSSQVQVHFLMKTNQVKSNSSPVQVHLEKFKSSPSPSGENSIQVQVHHISEYSSQVQFKYIFDKNET